jgi:hypothetical protein
MSDRGFSLDHQHSHFTLIHPPFLQGKSQLSPKKIIETRIIARHRIHVERCMGRIKNFKFAQWCYSNEVYLSVKFLVLHMYIFHHF